MNQREAFHAMMNFERSELLCQFETGYWPETVERSRGPEQDWFAACRGGKTTWSNFDYASAKNEILMLGNVATQFEGQLEFDPQAMKIVNNAEADACLRSEYRQGWTL